jgi:hypothetical protein
MAISEKVHEVWRFVYFSTVWFEFSYGVHGKIVFVGSGTLHFDDVFRIDEKSEAEQDWNEVVVDRQIGVAVNTLPVHYYFR